MRPWYAWAHMGTPCVDTLKGFKMNPLTIRARHNLKRERLENYAIVVVAALVLAGLLAAFI